VAETVEAGGLLLQLGRSRYAIPLDVVAEVLRPLPVTRLPGLPAWVCGAANWRGRVLPVLDLRPLFAEPHLPHCRPRLVVLLLEGVGLGLQVDGVDGVSAAPPARLDPGTAINGEAAALLAGSAVDEEGPLAWLEPAALLALRRVLPQATSVPGAAARDASTG
jgi:purine-binding chemotaxis protein CheW